MIHKILVISNYQPVYSSYEGLLFDTEEYVSSAMRKAAKVPYSAVIYDAGYASGECSGFMEFLNEYMPHIPVVIISNDEAKRDYYKGIGASLVYFAEQFTKMHMEEIGSLLTKFLSLVTSPPAAAAEVAAAKQVTSLPLQESNDFRKNTMKAVADILLQIGITPNIKGFHFIREAIVIAQENPQILNRITNELYPKVAKLFDSTADRVERAIRHSIEVAWQKGKINNLNALYGIRLFNKCEKPSNGEIIALLCDKMLMETVL
ncbi:MAG: sporulation initiation factor Spo0A C-terminal domain-containing protein [Christensenellaceae bacterium]|jgi:hypothetical protein|nr:sporulation initiation factor Spo0A C-terminal domain-containing protein [Christensenellaceae bacterium]